MKIIVPQELEQQIIQMYNAGETRKAIKEKLSLPFGDSVIKRILLENNIEIRSNPGAQRGGRKKQEVDIEIQKAIINLYVNKHYGLNKIVKELKLPFGFDKVKSILQDNNIHVRNVQEAHEFDTEKYGVRKYSINDDYVLESHNGAWLLGFYAADGYLPITKGAKNKIVIALQAEDKEILEKIKEELEYTGPVYEYLSSEINGKRYPTVCLSFTSKKLREQFESYGICNNKTFNLEHLPQLPEEFMFDFIRGFIDGDGTIFKHHDWVNISATCASHNFLREMFEYIKTNLDLKYNGSIGPDHNNLSFTFSGNDSEILGAKLYDNDYLALERKKKKFNSLRRYSPTRPNIPQG